MILLVDIGNSRIKWVIDERGKLQTQGQVSHSAENWTELAARLWGSLERPARAIIVNVAGVEARASLTNWIWQRWAIEAEFVVSTATACGVCNAYAEPERLGADRWVAMIAARAIIGQNCYVVDCGTAITIDALAASGRHVGGVIIPGMRLMREALYRDTQQITLEDGQKHLFGQSTGDAVWGGTAYAVAAAIDGITARMEVIAGDGPRLLTGGDARAVLPFLQAPYQWEPDLIFQGLHVIAGPGSV